MWSLTCRRRWLKAASNAFLAAERAFDGPEDSTVCEQPLKRLLRTSRPGRPASLERPGGRTSWLPLPRISVLTGCRVLAGAHLHTGARCIVVRGLDLEC